MNIKLHLLKLNSSEPNFIYDFISLLTSIFSIFSFNKYDKLDKLGALILSINKSIIFLLNIPLLSIRFIFLIKFKIPNKDFNPKTILYS